LTPPSVWRRAAVVIASLDADTAHEVLRELDPAIRERLIREVAGRVPVSDSERRQAVREFLASDHSLAAPEPGSLDVVSRAEGDPRVAGDHRGASPLESVERLDDGALANLVRGTAREVAVLALAGAAPDFLSRVLSALSPSESQVLRDSMDKLGPMRLSDVAEAQSRLAERARTGHRDHSPAGRRRAG
jgi:flagellar motor switch protein FliG